MSGPNASRPGGGQGGLIGDEPGIEDANEEIVPVHQPEGDVSEDITMLPEDGAHQPTTQSEPPATAPRDSAMAPELVQQPAEQLGMPRLPSSSAFDPGFEAMMELEVGLEESIDEAWTKDASIRDAPIRDAPVQDAPIGDSPMQEKSIPDVPPEIGLPSGSPAIEPRDNPPARVGGETGAKEDDETTVPSVVDPMESSSRLIHERKQKEKKKDSRPVGRPKGSTNKAKRIVLQSEAELAYITFEDLDPKTRSKCAVASTGQVCDHVLIAR